MYFDTDIYFIGTKPEVSLWYACISKIILWIWNIIRTIDFVIPCSPWLSLLTILCILLPLMPKLGLPRWLRGKESACSAGDTDSIRESGISPGEGNGNPLQSSCLGYPLDTEAWQDHRRVGHNLMTKHQQ